MDKSKYVEIDFKSHTPRHKKPAIQKKLENSPQHPITPDVLDEKLKNADLRRKNIEKERSDAAGKEYERAKRVYEMKKKERSSMDQSERK